MMKRIGWGLVAVIMMLGIVWFHGGVVMEANAVTTTKDPSLKRDQLCNKVSDETLKASMGCSNKKTIPGVAQAIVNSVVGLVGVIAIGAVVYGGVTYVSSAGDPSKARRARDIIIYSLVGVVVAVLAFAIVNFVLGAVFGVATEE